MRNVAIFASGNGSNAENTIKELRNSSVAQVSVVITNNPTAGVIERTKQLNTLYEVITKSGSDSDQIMQILEKYRINIVLLQGYLRLLPFEVIAKYDGHILNQHPALLPKYGGKGMYGHFVHEAVAASGDEQSGFSLHQVTPIYDDGNVLWQETVDLPSEATAEQIEELVRELEKDKAASAIRKLIEDNKI